MKKQFLIISLFSFFIAINAQWNGTNPIITNSNVGIGTSDPNGKLHIRGTGSQNLLLENTGIGFSEKDNIWADLILARWEKYFLDFTNWGRGDAAKATVFRISAHQKEGKEATIALVRGAGSNLEFMDVYNNGYNDAVNYGIRIQKRGTGEFRDFIFDQYDGVTYNPLMTLKVNGNVGIGTYKPHYKLDVLGVMRAKEVKVDFSNKEFVFNNEYELMPLDELEDYIKKQKHLPQITPAQKMEDDGMELGKLNSRLLQKIEELTLYMIEQHKAIQELKQTVKQQSEQISQLKAILK